MKISILVPVYNVELYVADCIDSVIGQDHRDWELILVDDGSTDQSPSICDQYALRYPNQIVAIHTENGGPLRARIRAMEQSTGDVFVFLDADDCLRNDALEQIAQCFDAEACDMVLFDAGECNRFATRKIRHTLEVGEIFDCGSKQLIYKKIILGQIPNSVCLKAVRATRAEIPERFCQHSAKHGEDLLLSVHFLTNCNKIVYLNEELYQYRDRPGSAIHSFNCERKESIKFVHTELEKCIDVWNMPELKPLHNARKVRGWIENLKLLLKNRSTLTRKVFREQLRSMAMDPYFRNAYSVMDASQLSRFDRILAFSLMKKLYFPLHILSCAFGVVKK